MKAKLGAICLLLILLYCVCAVSAADADMSSAKILEGPNSPFPVGCASAQDMNLDGFQPEFISPFDRPIFIDGPTPEEGPYR